MFKHRRTLILAALALWTLMFAAIVALVFRAEVETGLEKRVARAFRADPELLGVEVVFQGANGVLEGSVSEERIIAKAERVATRILPIGEITENRVGIAKGSPRLRASLEGDIVVLEGEVSDQVVRTGVLETMRKLPGIEGVRDKLAISPDVRREEWVTPFLRYLPTFFAACPDGVAEATNEFWVLEGLLENELKRDELALGWERLVPVGAHPDVARLTFTPDIPKPAPAAMTAVAAAPALPPPLTPAATPDPAPPATAPAIRAVPIAQRLQVDEERLRILEKHLAEAFVTFAPNSSHLEASQLQKLTRAAEVLHAYKRPYRLEIVAWVDSGANAQSSQWLSERRAQQVQLALETQQVTVEKRTFESALTASRPPGRELVVELRVIKEDG